MTPTCTPATRPPTVLGYSNSSNLNPVNNFYEKALSNTENFYLHLLLASTCTNLQEKIYARAVRLNRFPSLNRVFISGRAAVASNPASRNRQNWILTAAPVGDGHSVQQCFE